MLPDWHWAMIWNNTRKIIIWQLEIECHWHLNHNKTVLIRALHWRHNDQLEIEFYWHLNPNKTVLIRALHWRHNDHDGVSNHQPHGCLLNRLYRRRPKKTSKICVTGLCVGNSPGPVNSPHKGPVTRKMFLFDDVIMEKWSLQNVGHLVSASFRQCHVWQNIRRTFSIAIVLNHHFPSSIKWHVACLRLSGRTNERFLFFFNLEFNISIVL